MTEQLDVQQMAQRLLAADNILILCHKNPDGDTIGCGSYRISVRTAKGVDACAIARRLGGGGHTRAAGCELLGDLENAKNAILAEVEAELDAPQEEA